MKDKIDIAIYFKAKNAAKKVGFLETKDEFNMYLSALYYSMLWHKSIS